MTFSDSEWEHKTHIIHTILQTDSLFGNQNDDGTKETISEQLLRGDSFPDCRFKAWAHVIIELQLSLASSNQEDDDDDTIHTIISSLETNMKYPNGSIMFPNVTHIGSDSLSPSSLLESHSTNTNTNTNTNTSTSTPMNEPSKHDNEMNNSKKTKQTIPNDVKPEKKKDLTMMERQELWLQKKQMKIKAHAEAARLAEEASLKFTPNISNSSKRYSSRIEPQTNITNRKTSTRKSRAMIDGRHRSGPSVSKSVNVRKHRTSKKPESAKRKQQKKKKINSELDTTSDNVIVVEEDHNRKESIASAMEKNMNLGSPEQDVTPFVNEEETVKDTTEDIIQSSTEQSLQEPKSFVKGSFFTGISGENHRARVQVRDPNQFQISSMYQKRDRESGLGSVVALLVGSCDQPPYDEKVIEILFDTEAINEEDASSWYDLNKNRFESPRKDRLPSETEK